MLFAIATYIKLESYAIAPAIPFAVELAGVELETIIFAENEETVIVRREGLIVVLFALNSTTTRSDGATLLH